MIGSAPFPTIPTPHQLRLFLTNTFFVYVATPDRADLHYRSVNAHDNGWHYRYLCETCLIFLGRRQVLLTPRSRTTGGRETEKKIAPFRRLAGDRRATSRFVWDMQTCFSSTIFALSPWPVPAVGRTLSDCPVRIRECVHGCPRSQFKVAQFGTSHLRAGR